MEFLNDLLGNITEVFDVIVTIFETLGGAAKVFVETIQYHMEAGTALPEMYKEVILSVHDAIYGGWEDTGFDKVVVGKVFEFILKIFGQE